MTTPGTNDQRSGGRRVGEWIALGLHVAVGFFPYSATGLLMRLEGMAVMYAIWFALFAVAWRWRPRNPWYLLSVPLGAIVIWIAAMRMAEALLGLRG